MLSTHFKVRVLATPPLLSCVKRLSTVNPHEAEYTAEPKYPPILDPSKKAKERRAEETWHDKIKSHPTIEEKLFEINMPKYYGWHCVMVPENHAPYNYLPMAQFSTRTIFGEEKALSKIPDKERISKLVEELLPTVKGPVEDVIAFEHSCKPRKRPSDELLLHAINRILLSSLAPSVPHLSDVEICHNPRVEAFWFLGGVDEPPMEELERHFRQEFYKNHKPFTTDRPYQFVGQPILQVKSQQPLPEITRRVESDNPTEEVAHYPYDPSVHGYENKYRHAVTLPGFWPGDRYEFGLFSFHSRKHLDNRSSEFEPEEHVEAAHASAIFSSYSWLLGQACFQGFNDDVLRQILQMYLFAPCPRSDVVMKPYLGENNLIHQIDYGERREWIHTRFRHLMANRPRVRPIAEPTTAAKIFLTYFPLDRVKQRLQYFQLGIDPHDRRLDDHALKYRPRKLRTRKCQKKYRTYYPGTNLQYDYYDRFC